MRKSGGIDEFAFMQVDFKVLQRILILDGWILLADNSDLGPRALESVEV